MPRRASRVCSTPGCPKFTQRGKCDTCETAYQRIIDARRDTSTQRGYARNPAHRAFREAVLARDDHTCQVQLPGCTRTATVADHWPLSRRDLVAQGRNPNDPAAGRATCAPCHSKETARLQPGGWHAR